MTTQEYVNKEADINCISEDDKRVYMDGLSAGIELIFLFDEWRCKNESFVCNRGRKRYTTSELFEIFLTERNEK